jgi:nanoRNase/pAp phosphatase (c-di-AMP/oligoRNAs hydrolase)
MSERFRLLTRPDFDGLVCAVLLRELGMIADIQFVHPKDMQDGLIPVTDLDITANLPFVAGVRMAFDHHASEATRVADRSSFILDAAAPSAARVIYNHFGGKTRFPNISEEMLVAVDKADSADYGIEEVMAPDGWALLNFIIDPRTGLGRFSHFSTPTDQLLKDLIVHCRNPSIDEILELPDIKERVLFYFDQAERAEAQILRCAKHHGHVTVVDLRTEAVIHPCNRFLVYALFPQCSVSIHALWGPRKEKTVFAVGKSVMNRSSKTKVGDLMLVHGGGGHDAAGTCQVPNESASSVLAHLIDRMMADG